ncbi:hypothetical protein HID58_077554 [Brassica napus]|uniref:Uncharacterized protein n=1 Tax=Brassica napus TaxID=3708 RepID=A0ABQ7YR03_BRANA|nr:hypothetical protein HID58_077554 [Brassica napus]
MEIRPRMVNLQLRVVTRTVLPGKLRWSKKCSVAAYTNLDENKIIWKKGGIDPYIDFSCANIASKFTAKSTRQCRRRFDGVHIFYDYDPLKKMHFCVRLDFFNHIRL